MNYQSFYCRKPKGAFHLKYIRAKKGSPCNIIITQTEYTHIRKNEIPRQIIIPFKVEFPTMVDRDIAMYLTHKYKYQIMAVSDDKIITIEDDLDNMKYQTILALLSLHNKLAVKKNIPAQRLSGKQEEIKEKIRRLRRSGVEVFLNEEGKPLIPKDDDDMEEPRSENDNDDDDGKEEGNK